MSENLASNVLTSENAAEFYAQKLGLAPAESASEAEVAEKQQAEPELEADGSEPEAKEEAKPQDEPKKQNPKLERRFSEITKQREEARREAEAERQRRVELEQRLAALEQQKPKQEFVDEEPQPSQFQDAFEYAKALAEYTADKRIEEMKRQEAEAQKAAERQKMIESWTQKVEQAKSELPDFDDMVASSDVVVSDDIRDAILESDVGPKILYHLAENSEFAKKVAGMPTRAALKEIGKLEARFEAKAEEKPVAKSKAPAPVTPLKAVSGVAETKLSSDGNWYGSYAEWKAARKAGKVR